MGSRWRGHRGHRVAPGTPDPTSGLYNSTMVLLAALLAIALVAKASELKGRL